MNDAVNIWTYAMVKHFVQLHRDPRDYSFGQMSRMMSEEFNITLTRNALIGKARRLGLPMRDQTKPPRKPIGKTMIKARTMREIEAPIPAIIDVQLPGLHVVSGLNIYQTTHRDCKWPLGEMLDRPPYVYCGNPVVDGCPYCKKHATRAFNAPRTTWS